MPEAIYKLQPDRTVHLRGFDHLGASAAVYDATPNAFRVAGQFRDASDFAVVVLYDADNFFEHPRLKYLPDFRFDGLTLTFDVSYAGLMPLNSRKYPTIDWPYLDVAMASGGTARVPLAEHATVIANPDVPAAAQFDIVDAGLDAWDRLTLWYQNLAFDYIVPGKVRTEYAFYAGTPGAFHSITVRDRAYTYQEQDGDTSAQVASKLIALINGAAPPTPADPEVTASAGADAWIVKIETLLDSGATVPVTASGYLTETLHHIRATTACRALRDQINGAGYAEAQTPYALAAVADGTHLKLSTVEGGYDADFISMHAVSKNQRLSTAQSSVQFRGGVSSAHFRVTIDFAALGLTSIRQMWLTFAPRLANGRDFEAGDWSAAFSNWTVTGPDSVRRLKVAGPRSVRVGSMDGRCEYSGFWTQEDGFFFENIARAARMPGSTVTFRYYCAERHDLWIGTSLYAGRGAARVEVDGVLMDTLDAALAAEPAVVTRRKVASALAPGDHVVRLTTVDEKPFYFDFAEAVVEDDVPDALPANRFSTPALDYSTDHSYKLPPARILWILEKLGYTGPLNEYIGVFWWNQRKRSGGSYAEVQVRFSGTFVDGDQVFLRIGGQTCGKTVFPNDSPEIIARHFAFLINATYVGVWARAEGATLYVRARSADGAYRFLVDPSVSLAGGSTGEVSGGGLLGGGSMGTWELDPDAEPVLNTGARAWHTDFYALCAQRGREVVTAVSMELVNPPDAFAARFAGGSAVLTDTGFGGLRSTHCAFSSQMLAYQKRVFAALAGLMSEAGLTPNLQLGEFTWWYFAGPGPSMGYYDSETAAAAQSALGRPLHVFTGPDDDPGANSGQDALFLRNRLKNFVDSIIVHVRAAKPGAQFELLFPYDVNHPEPAGAYKLGGRLNRYVNLPEEWGHKASAGFDRFRVEALNYGAWSRDLDLARSCLSFPIGLGWPPGSVRAMIPAFRGGYPWFREVSYAEDLGMESVGLWAFDHMCLFGWAIGVRGLGHAFRKT